jgi:hypothetical protein
MALHWDVSKVKNYETLCFRTLSEGEADPNQGTKAGDRVETSLTRTLVFGCMNVGLGTITERNWRTWYARFHLFEKLNGAFLSRRIEGTDKWESRYVTPEEVHAHIGLSTNVSKESDAAWRKRIVASFARDYERDADRWLEKSQRGAA